MTDGRRIVLGCATSAALHKGVDLASKLTQAGHQVRTVLTPRAAQLVSPQLFEAVTGGPAFFDEHGAHRRAAMDHIDLGRWAELLVYAPASADLVGRLANGVADDLLCTLALATPLAVPRLIAPAMNPHMLEHPAVQRNLGRLREDGWQVLEPGSGWTACGDEGKGRLPEPPEIVRAVEAALAR